MKKTLFDLYLEEVQFYNENAITRTLSNVILKIRNKLKDIGRYIDAGSIIATAVYPLVTVPLIVKESPYKEKVLLSGLVALVLLFIIFVLELGPSKGIDRILKKIQELITTEKDIETAIKEIEKFKTQLGVDPKTKRYVGAITKIQNEMNKAYNKKDISDIVDIINNYSSIIYKKQNTDISKYEGVKSFIKK